MPTAEDAAAIVVRAVAAHYGITADDIMGARRLYLTPRRVAVWLVRDLTGASYPTLGRLFGRDHSTMVTAVQAITFRIDVFPAFGAAIAAIRQRIDLDAPAAPVALPGARERSRRPAPMRRLALRTVTPERVVPIRPIATARNTEPIARSAFDPERARRGAAAAV